MAERAALAPYTFLSECANARVSDSVIRTRVVLPDLNNTCHELDVELLSNPYNLLVPIWMPRSERGRRRTVIGAAA